MDRNEVERRVRRVVCRILKVDEEMVSLDSHFVFDLGAESTQAVELVGAFEGEFDIEMDEDAALMVKTVGSAVDFITGHLPVGPDVNLASVPEIPVRPEEKGGRLARDVGSR
ncbi:MAG: phosphopantetheine-binding protein [Thermoguttaceae bacterium]|jgi:acyl carrier protein